MTVTDVLQDIKDYFVAHSLGTFGTNLFIGYMPPDPDQVTVLRAGGAWGPVDHHSAGAKPFVDFDCRAADSATAFGMVQAILTAMTDLHDLSINSNHYILISSQYAGPQQFYPWDDKNRVIWSGTLKIMMRPIYMASSY
jgi:hypothetical protein